MKPTRSIVACVSVALVHVARADPGAPGQFAVGQRSVSVTRADSTTFTAQVFYPATAGGTNQPFAPGAAPAPAVSFGHGFFQPVSRYASTLRHLAGHGYIVIASESEGSLFPSHARFASDLSRCLTFLEQQNSASGSWLEGRVDAARFGLSGHSMGGGCAILAAAADARVKALAPLAPAETNPSAIAASPALTMPTIFIVGDADTIVPTATNGRRMYDATDSPRQLASIRGGSHCGFIDAATFGCDALVLARADQLLAVRRSLTAWFDLHLRDAQSSWPVVWGPASPADSAITLTADPRCEVRIASAAVALPVGELSEIAFTLTNTDEQPRALTVRANAADGLAPPPLEAFIFGAPTGPIAPGVSVETVLRVLPGVDAATIVVSAEAQNARAWSALTITPFCLADFNQDGGADGADVEAFFDAWEAGSPAADVNGDGGIDGADVEVFFRRWEAGC